MLNFNLSEEQRLMKETAARFTSGAVADLAHEMDESRILRPELLQHLWELGIIQAGIPEEYGGYGMPPSPVMNAIVLEELAAGDMALAIAAMVPALFLYPVLELGTDEQKRTFLDGACGERFTPRTMAICEPRFGFDPQALETTATLSGSACVITGRKCFVPLAADSSHLLVAADCAGEASLIVVPALTPGMTVGERERNQGIQALPTYPVTFTDCVVPAGNRLPGGGAAFTRILSRTRAALAAIGTGVARASYEYARDYARERVQFGEPIANRQSVAFMIAEMAYEVDAMRLLAWQAASVLESGQEALRESFLAKLYAGEMAMKVADYGVQVLGGHGYIRDHPVERYYRNGRGIAILDGMAII